MPARTPSELQNIFSIGWRRVDSSNPGSPIQNFCVVTPNVLWRGARPDKEGAAWLIQQDVRTIVSLELILDDKFALSQAAITDGNVYKASYFRIHDWEALPILAPSVADDHVGHFLAIVSDQPKPVYVHCHSGMNRTGVMVAAYRVLVEDVGGEEAIAEMKRYRGVWFEAEAKYIRGLSPKHGEEILQKVLEWTPKLKMDARIICENGTCTVIEN